MNDIDALAEVAQNADLSSVRRQLAHLLRILRSAGIVLSDRRVVKAQSLIAAAAVVAGRSKPKVWDAEVAKANDFLSQRAASA